MDDQFNEFDLLEDGLKKFYDDNMDNIHQFVEFKLFSSLKYMLVSYIWNTDHSFK